MYIVPKRRIVAKAPIFTALFILIIVTMVNAGYCAKLVEVWSYKADGKIFAIDMKDNLIAFSTEDKVYLINKTKIVKKFEYSGVKSIRFYEDGILLGDYDTIFFINYSGYEIWSRTLGDTVRDIDFLGNVIAVASSKKCFLLDNNGKITNAYDSISIITSVDIDNSNVFYGDAKGRLYLNGVNIVNFSKYIADVETYKNYTLIGYGTLLRAIYGKGVYIWEEPLPGYVEDLDVYGDYILAVTEEYVLVYKNRKKLDKIKIGGLTAGAIYGNKIAVAFNNVIKLYKLIEGPKIIVKSPKNGSKADSIKIDVETDIPSQINIYIDGKKFPLYIDIIKYGKGIHKIEIEAIDKYGNKNKTVIYVYAVEKDYDSRDLNKEKTEDKKMETLNETVFKKYEENITKSTLAGNLKDNEENSKEDKKVFRKIFIIAIIVLIVIFIFFNFKNRSQKSGISRYKFKRKR